MQIDEVRPLARFLAPELARVLAKHCKQPELPKDACEEDKAAALRAEQEALVRITEQREELSNWLYACLVQWLSNYEATTPDSSP